LTKRKYAKLKTLCTLNETTKADEKSGFLGDGTTQLKATCEDRRWAFLDGKF
jgi:hypothetical protein